ncbi:hypothetical protein DBR23_12830 [Acidovorax sp. HMWF018]|uniref:GmrSD restriction endonuclease domain-containing protein n=1 Tax=unclassified Acidovorax TaxID=2684926 RepID=UPI000D3A5FF4|nr:MULTISPECIES: DUF262 domain-containing protein [unclassified Acidovorax]MCT6719587.1 DUF262 domain-containing protein [Acidovorax sp. K2F]PTT38891.1 hypothetical protein DBR23_12830 [Acidovorax sp. HMWF018]
MQANLSIKGITVQNIYSQYLLGYYLINRRYQRKLVWSIDEKAKFIDSILNGYPIPMILGANYKKADDSNALEVLDGMQRLNAVTSFIEGEFSVSSHYFNLEAIAQTKAKKDSGELIQKEPALPIDECAKILDYPVPFSIFDESEPLKLDESFRRINTGGRTLSKQDVRQAGSLGLIPESINEAAIYIRKDSSHSNFVDLRNMRSISLSNRGLAYGINLTDIFWAKHGIITQDNIRMSRDEELVAHLLSYIADCVGAQTTSHYLDEIYDSQTNEAEQLARQINKLGKETLLRHFKHVFEELKKTIECRDQNFKSLVFKGKPNKVTQVYQVIFIAMHKAIIQENLKIANYENLQSSLEGIFDAHLTSLNSDQKWTAQEREALSNAVLGVIRKNFAPKVGIDRNLSGWVENLENILNESRTEQVCYDFKMGFCQITGAQSPFLPKVVSKIVKTLTAMTNTKPGECYVIVGVADKESDALIHDTHFGSTSVRYKTFFITGIDEEAKMYHGDLSQLEQKIIQQIDKEPISDEFKAQIKANLVTFSYGAKEICLFKAVRGTEPAMYHEKFYARALSHNEEIESTKYFTFFKMFEKDSALAQK